MQINKRVESYGNDGKPLPEVSQKENAVFFTNDEKQCLHINTVTYEELLNLVKDESLNNFYRKCLDVANVGAES